MAVCGMSHDAWHLAHLGQACARGAAKAVQISMQSAVPGCWAGLPQGMPRKAPNGLPAQGVKIV